MLWMRPDGCINLKDIQGKKKKLHTPVVHYIVAIIDDMRTVSPHP